MTCHTLSIRTPDSFAASGITLLDSFPADCGCDHFWLKTPDNLSFYESSLYVFVLFLFFV